MVKAYVQVGRVRHTGAVGSPTESGYINQMKAQSEAIAGRIQAVIDGVKNNTPESIRKALKPIYDLSQQYVPVDTGDLKASGFLEVENTRSGAVRVAIGYGRYGNPWYAALVHERTDFRHAKGKKAKFLESAVKERIHVFKTLLVQDMTSNVSMSVGAAKRLKGFR